MNPVGKGTCEIDCRSMPIPKVGSKFTISVNGRSSQCTVTSVRPNPNEGVRQNFLATIGATHLVEFTLP